MTPARTRDALVVRHLPLARRLARRYARSADRDDLAQAAALGLVKAANRYDPNRGTPFERYAAPTILGEIRRHCRDTRWAVHVPRDLQELAQGVAREVDRLTPVLGRSPTVRELAGALGATTEQVIEARQALAGIDTSPLHPVTDAHEAAADAPAEMNGAVDGRYELVEGMATIAPAVAELPQREREVLSLRFFEDMTQSEIGQRIGVSQMHVSRLLRRSIEHIRASVDLAA